MQYKIDNVRLSSTERAQSVNGEFKAPEGAFLTSICTETGNFTYSYIEVAIEDEWYPISLMNKI